MSSLNLTSMRSYLSKSIPSLNQNKVNGMLAEIDLRIHLSQLGFENKISQGGWIVRNTGNGVFGHHTSVFFPMTIIPNKSFSYNRKLEEPPRRLHTICSTMHQIGIHSYYCIPTISEKNDANSIAWDFTQLGIPDEDSYHDISIYSNIFIPRKRRYNFLTNKTNARLIPSANIPEEFSKESLRIHFQNKYMCEMADIDGVFWGEQYTYPIEIKEKTSAFHNKVGEYFGIDVGPFVKLAFYAAKKGNLHSIFIVKEIDDVDSRNLLNWWFITFDTLAQYASWVPIGGGQNMRGGGSTTILIPKSEFKELNLTNIKNL